MFFLKIEQKIYFCAFYLKEQANSTRHPINYGKLSRAIKYYVIK